jgi:putative DNA primase/helicase
MTWFMDVVEIAPLAVITAPEKRCGKSQLLFLLGRLAKRPLTASNVSPAALFRAVDAWRPTLLVDEADAFVRENDELRGIINAGHTRDSAYVVRVVGDDFKPTKFSVWGAKALAGIGHLADTLVTHCQAFELAFGVGTDHHTEPFVCGLPSSGARDRRPVVLHSWSWDNSPLLRNSLSRDG